MTEAGLDRTEFETLVVKHGGICFRVARALSNDDGLAEEIVQNAFLSAFRARTGFRGQGSARAWLITITRNAAYRELTKQQQRPTESLSELGSEAGWGSEDPESVAIAAERKQALACALSELDPADREILTLRDLEQLGGTETCEILGIGLTAMKSRLHRARLRLAVQLRKGASV